MPLASAAALALAFSSQSLAGEWKFTPTVTLAETYTDNLRLTSPGTEKSDFVTQVSPGISVEGHGRGLRAKVDYVMQNLAYAHERNGISTNHQLNAVAGAELVEELFFLDGKAGISQKNISPFGPQPNNINDNDNRSNVKTWSLSPYLQHRFGQSATAQLRYAYEGVDASNSSLQNARTSRVVFNVDSGPAFKSLGWGFSYNDQTTTYTNAPSLTMTQTALKLRYRLSPQFSLTAIGGYERNNYASLGENPSGAFWNGGAEWTPTERTHIAASAGRRFYGNSYSLMASERTRNTVWSLGYQEDVATTQSQFLVPVTIDTASFLDQLWRSSIPDAETRAQIIEAFMLRNGLPTSLAAAVNTFTNRVFLQKNTQASVAVSGTRNTVVLSLFNTRREAQSTQSIDNALPGASAATLQDNTRQTGGSLIWNHRLSPRTSMNLTGNYARVDSLSTGRVDHNKSARLALVQKIKPKLTGTLEVRRVRHDSTEVNTNYVENAMSIYLLMMF